MTAPRTIRTKVARRLVTLIGRLDGFSELPEDNQWWVLGAHQREGTNRRWVMIGEATFEGEISPEALAAGRDPSIDSWAIECSIACTDIDDEWQAQQAVEDALGDIRDMLAADPRLTLAGASPAHLGVDRAAVGVWNGPIFTRADPDADALAAIEFTIVVTAHLSSPA